MGRFGLGGRVQDCVRQGAEHKPTGTYSRRVLDPATETEPGYKVTTPEAGKRKGPGRGPVGSTREAPALIENRFCAMSS